MVTVGFIGGGRVTRILAGGWRRAGAFPARAMVHDPSRDAISALQAEVTGVEPSSIQEVADADVVFVALHPPVLVAGISSLKTLLRRDAVLVSLAPKISIAALAEAAGTSRIARMIPNAPSLVGCGYNPVTFGEALNEPARATLRALFGPWGEAPEVPEAQLEAYAILTGMGPTYFWFQWQALREMASEFGLTRSESDVALRAMIDGALATLLDSGLTPKAVMDMIPVKPLAEMEPGVTAAYRTALPALYAKIRAVNVSAA